MDYGLILDILPYLSTQREFESTVCITVLRRKNYDFGNSITARN